MKQQQQPGPNQGNDHHEADRGLNSEGKAGSTLQEETMPDSQETQQGSHSGGQEEAGAREEDDANTLGIP